MIYPDDGSTPVVPVVFIDPSTAHSLIADDDISQILLNELDLASDLFHNTDRLYLVVVNSAPTTVVGKVVDVTHGVQHAQPGVPDDDGKPTRPPDHGTGATDNSVPWMDVPPAGCAAVGMWIFEQASGMSLYGIQSGVVVELPELKMHLTFAGEVPYSSPFAPSNKIASYVVVPATDDTATPTSVDYSPLLPITAPVCGDYMFQLRPYIYDHDNNGFDRFFLGLLFISSTS